MFLRRGLGGGISLSRIVGLDEVGRGEGKMKGVYVMGYRSRRAFVLFVEGVAWLEFRLSFSIWLWMLNKVQTRERCLVLCW